jgi:hypothetical protein
MTKKKTKKKQSNKQKSTSEKESKQTRKSPCRTVTDKMLLKAIPGTYGIVKKIADKLDVSYLAAYNAIRRASKEVLIELEMEKERVDDVAEGTIIEAMEQRIDLPEASKNARWVLDGKRGYVRKKEVTLQGGKSPIRVKSDNVISIESLNLPLAVRKQMLEAIEEKEKEEEDDE